jgi:large subunit ribosomal protein L10
MTLKKKFRTNLEVLVAKNRLASMALEKSSRPEIKDFVGNLKGQNALIFTNYNVFKLYLILEKNKINLPARAGDIVTEDIVLPYGNTGIAPGPVLSEFKEAGVPTKIDVGSIWITKDTVVGKPGDVITPKLAGLLARMNLKPIKAGVSIISANMDGRTLKEEDIKIDLGTYHERITSAIKEVYSLALEAAYPLNEVLPMLLSKGFNHAKNVAIFSHYVSKDTVSDLLSLGERHVHTLHEIVKSKGY